MAQGELELENGNCTRKAGTARDVASGRLPCCGCFIFMAVGQGLVVIAEHSGGKI